ncbi:uncharacterized protein F5891DRAFT_983778 [Suillus fuscotomentosus]|uniref:Uncharacterized protein n=1 Tax=Suillus fuscotomentosus TaxID=1912939 RepID=A0AAD4DXU2_9AGAM|nr:uncharacterized protein F5891DRAFT_983778 [Suillus fuscotomentosus]KAG1896080.1 hypothetical protein F5891DRAFT_983778 [Suillus fuscotomentosus]
MHACIIPPSRFADSTRRLSFDHETGNATPGFYSDTCLQKTFEQAGAVNLPRTYDASPTAHIGPSPPSSSPTITNDFLDDDTNAPTSLPPVIRHLNHVVKRAKEKYKPYNRNRPRTMELRFAEKYIGPSDMGPVDVQRTSCQGKVLAEHGLKHMSCEAIAQAVLTKEADLEWKRMCALASAWEIEVLRRHERLAHIIHNDKARIYASATSEPLLASLETLANSDLDSGELQSRLAFAIAAYSQDKSLYSATDEQFDHLEHLAREHYVGAIEDNSPASPIDSDASASSSGVHDSGIVRGISEISTKSDD